MNGTSGSVTGRKGSALLAYLGCIRYQDVLILQGSPMFGALFALGDVTASKLAVLGLFALASVLLVAHIFSLNDWAGAAADANDPNKAASVFLTRGVGSREVLALSGSLLLSSLVICALLPGHTLVLGAAIAALGILYSHPWLNAKAMPVMSSLPHLLGGLLHFLFGYSLFSPIDGRGILIGLFFALTFAAGHLNQEVRDYDGDRINGLRTNAVVFGRARTFGAGLLAFTLAYADLVVLARAGLVPAAVGALPFVLYPLHAFWAVTTLRSGLTFESVSRLQSRYRILYAIIGLTMAAALLYR